MLAPSEYLLNLGAYDEYMMPGESYRLVELFMIIGFFTIIATIVAYRDHVRNRKTSEDVRNAEHQAFKEVSPDIRDKVLALIQTQKKGEERTQALDRLLEESRESLSVSGLFNLYSKQIVQYQEETRSRATWSFIFAMLAMFAGFGFVIWGGSVLVGATESIVLASGGLISAVGAAISGFITKTFLEVHKISLAQLNRYFQQPVINDHILMAQRLADDSDDPNTKKDAYARIIASITTLIHATDEPSDDDS